MKCSEFDALLIPFVERELDGETARLMEEHRAQCESCRAKAEEMSLLFQDLNQLDEDATVPQSFQDGWRKAVEEEAMKMKQTEDAIRPKESDRRKKFQWKPLASIAAALVFLVGGTLLTKDMDLLAPSESGGANQYTNSTTGSSPRSMSAKSDAGNVVYDDVEMPIAGTADMMEESAVEFNTQEVKIIRTASLTVSTLTFDQDVETFKTLCESLGGWVEYTSIYGDDTGTNPRSASLTMRVPETELTNLLSQIQTGRRITNYSESATDVTENYYDTALRLSTQQEKMARLQELLKNATEMSDLLEIESAIADTQYQLDSYQTRLNSLDKQVTYSTVDIYVREALGADAAKEQSLSLGDRIAQGFTASIKAAGQFLQDMVVFLTMAAPWLVGLGVLAGITLLIVKRKRNQ